MFDKACGLTGDNKPSILIHATNSIASAAATVYEAEIASCRPLGALQRDKALSDASKAFSLRSRGAVASNFVYPPLYEIAIVSAESLQKRAVKSDRKRVAALPAPQE